MTLDDLVNIFDDTQWAVHSRRAAIRAVVAAIRDHLSNKLLDERVYGAINEILASDGEEAAGTDTAVTETRPEAIERSAPAAALTHAPGCPANIGYECACSFKSEAAR